MNHITTCVHLRDPQSRTGKTYCGANAYNRFITSTNNPWAVTCKLCTSIRAGRLRRGGIKPRRKT